MERVLVAAREAAPNVVGAKFTHNDLADMQASIRAGFDVLIGSGDELLGPDDVHFYVDALYKWICASTPERRVATARGKLFGANPCHLLNREVAGNPMLEADMGQRARTVVSGLENSARHALRHQSTLSVEDQVRVLVDLATDPASLGRHWCGLTLWV